MEVECRVTKVHEDGKLDLSVRKKAFEQMDDDAVMILDYVEKNGGSIPFTDKSDPEKIKETFGISKNAFKRAVGRLFKEHKIQIKENGIELSKK